MSVMDSVDKYRHGVLIGNFVEDKFGKDLDEKVITINLFRGLIQMRRNYPRQKITTIFITLCISLMK